MYKRMQKKQWVLVAMELMCGVAPLWLIEVQLLLITLP